MPVSKWVLAGAALLAAAALTLWLTRSDAPTEYVTPEDAVIAVCHADPARTPFSLTRGNVDYAPAVDGVGRPLVWVAPGESRPRLALLEQTDNEKFTVRTCGARIRIAP